MYGMFLNRLMLLVDSFYFYISFVITYALVVFWLSAIENP